MSFFRNGSFVASVVLAVAVAVWLHWPSIDSGFRGDDYVQAAMVRGKFSVPRDAFDLFDFASGDAADNRTLTDFGYLPWWSVPKLRLRMWRPIASALMAADYACFGERARPQHLHSLAWFVTMLLSAAVLLRQLVPKAIAALALIFFALEEGHATPVAWIANRSTLVAATFAFLACAAYVRMREQSSRGFGVLVAVLTSAALFSGEYSFTALAYIAAYECCMARGDLATRARASLPATLPVLAYLGLHAVLGRDVVGSGYYISPIASPLHFVTAALVRVPVLVADLVLGFPSSYYNMGSPFRGYVLSHQWFSPAAWHKLPDWTTGHALIGWAALLGYAQALRWLAHRVPDGERPALLTCGLGVLFSLLPSVGALPGDRLVGGAALGVCVLGATLLLRASPFTARDLSGLARVGRALACAWILWVLGAQSFLRAHSQSTWFAHESAALRVWSLDADLPTGPDAGQQEVYVVAAMDFTTAANLPWLRLLHHKPLSRVYRRLMPGTEPMDVQRLDEHTLEIRVLSSDVIGDATPSLYRDDKHPLHDGFRARLPGLSVHVLRTFAGNPLAVRFRFDRSIDDPRLWFLQSTPEGLRRTSMPKVGELIRLPRPALRDLRVLGRGFADAVGE